MEAASQVRDREFNVLLPGEELAIPDLVVIDCPGFEGLAIEARHVSLVVEVIALGNAGVDRSVKPPKYAAAGIPLFLRVEPDSRRGPVIFAAELVDGKYEDFAVARPGRPLVLTDPFPFTVDPAELTRSGRAR